MQKPYYLNIISALQNIPESTLSAIPPQKNSFADQRTRYGFCEPGKTPVCTPS